MRNSTELQLPFTGSWLVYWGGDTAKQNQHHSSQAQRHAFDFVKTDADGSWHAGDGAELKDYYSFGEPVTAPAAGRVIEAVDGFRDNPIGTVNPFNNFGNHVLLEHAARHEFSVLAHLQQGSVDVSAGDIVDTADQVAKCGNSGYSTHPHLHYHLQFPGVYAEVSARTGYKQVDVARGIKVFFRQLVVVDEHGIERAETGYSPVKGEHVSNP